MTRYSQTPALEEVLETLHAAREVCSRFEKKYKMLSDHFFELYSAGLLDDEGLNRDFIDWAGSHKTTLECEREIDAQLRNSSVPEKVAHLKNHALVS